MESGDFQSIIHCIQFEKPWLKSDRAIWNLDLRLLKFQSWQRCTRLLHC